MAFSAKKLTRFCLAREEIRFPSLAPGRRHTLELSGFLGDRHFIRTLAIGPIGRRAGSIGPFGGIEIQHALIGPDDIVDLGKFYAHSLFPPTIALT